MSTIKSSAENLTLNADGANNDIKFQSNGVEKASIDQDGNVIASGTISSTGDTTITSGDIVFATAGKGVDFSANTDASTGGVGDEVLDDYEEGTWLARWSFGGGTTGIVYLNTAANYTKIGRLVAITGYIQINNKGSSTGDVLLTGLPFTVGSGNGNTSVATIACREVSFANQIDLETDPGMTSLRLREIRESDGAATAITDSNFSPDTFMRFSLIYNV